MNDITTCGTCRYFNPDADAENIGNCHVNPPTIIKSLVTHYRKKSDGHDLNGMVIGATVFPATYSDYPACRFFAEGQS